MKKIALEEHFMAPGFSEYEADVAAHMDPDKYMDFASRLPDFDERRLEAMDKANIEICVLSQTSPGLQIEKDPLAAILKARQVNDFLARQIEKHPKRFAGFAHLSMHDPVAAVIEIKRCVSELGFKGALINGHTNGLYLDDDQYIPFWETLQELNVPLYLHPANSFDSPHMFAGYPSLTGAMWGWTVETATHALRLIVSGLFDRVPRVRIILGHMGECLPFMLWRLDSRWNIVKQPRQLKKEPSQYLRDNFLVTTSGVCDNAPLLCTIDALGTDNVLFSTDYPFESALVAAEFIDKAPLSEEQRAKICRHNAEKILRL